METTTLAITRVDHDQEHDQHRESVPSPVRGALNKEQRRGHRDARYHAVRNPDEQGWQEHISDRPTCWSARSGFGPRARRTARFRSSIDEAWSGRRWVAELDIWDCFGAIPHDRLMSTIE